MSRKVLGIVVLLAAITYGPLTSGQDLRLPYKGQVCTNEAAFSIINTCQGPAGFFFTQGVNSSATAFSAGTNGLGSAGYFSIKNEGSKSPTLLSITNGLGPAGHFLNSNYTNVSPPGDTLLSETQGRGSFAGHFVTLSPENKWPTLRTETHGQGPAGQFIIWNPASDANALTSSTAGLGRAAVFVAYNRENWSPALRASTSGLGAAGVFTIDNKDNIFPAVYGTSIGSGNGVLGLSQGPGAAVRGYAEGGGSSIVAYQQGYGLAANFIKSNVDDSEENRNPVLNVANFGGGSAAVFASRTGNWPEGTIVAINTLSWGAAVAAYFIGNIKVHGIAIADSADIYGNLTAGSIDAGEISKRSGSFKIDHPLDPENRYLYHSFVESPDMKNVYDGIVILDKKGEASVSLPDYFEALNRDFRYQLTPIGGPAPDLHIAEKITGNKFKIAGGEPGLEVSWQVTGIRQDAYAKAHPIIPEVGKEPENRGKYLTPAEFGKAEELGIHFRKGDQEYVNQLLQQLKNQEEKDKKDIDNLSKTLKILKEQGKAADIIPK